MTKRRRGNRRRQPRWRQNVDPLRHGLVCPNCGATYGRHGRGGKRACRATYSALCPGIECLCDQTHFRVFAGQLIWRQSPCLDAACRHCGWRGQVASIDFERAYGFGRCVATEDGRHDVVVSVENSSDPSKITVVLHCKACGAFGSLTFNPITDIAWQKPARKED